LKKAENVHNIELDKNILEIIENQFPELLKRIKEGEPNE
jgi:hypothetical protein